MSGVIDGEMKCEVFRARCALCNVHPLHLIEFFLDYHEVFDSSFARGAPAIFTPETVVPGWTEALQKMRVGDEWLLYVPPELGYGARGQGRAIPANSVLIFRIKLLDVARVPGGGSAGTAMG